MASAVPYQAYRSKRHSRTVSTLPIIPPNVPPPSRVLQWDTENHLVLDLVSNTEPPTPPTQPEPPLPDIPPTINGKHKQPDSPSPSSSSVPLPATPKKLSTFRRLHPRPSPARAALPSSPLLAFHPSTLHQRFKSSKSKSIPHSQLVLGYSFRIIEPTSTSYHFVGSSTTPNHFRVIQSLAFPHNIPTPVDVTPPVWLPSLFRTIQTWISAKGRILVTETRCHTRRTYQTRKASRKTHPASFPPQASESKMTKRLSSDRRKSSFFDLDLARLKNMDASDIWKGVVQSPVLQGAKADVRAAEQRIAPWQEDAAVSKCPLCTTSFHPLTNRKHHCRLCGQIICSLPTKRPQRPQPCSILFIVDSKTRKIEQVGEGVHYGVTRRASSAGKGGSNEKEKDETLADDEKFLKGVRVCRNCKPILSREQFYQEVSRIPPLVRLYEGFISLEKEIEEALPQFQELLLTLNSDSPPSKDAATARKRILDDLASYDAISKRIRKIPCTPGSSQDRIQLAIRTRADLFLQKNMFPLQTLPKAKKQVPSPDAATPLVDPDSELAHALQPLLEQEALLESFVGEAMAHRKFEDAKTLKANLKEIRAEVDRMLQNQAENDPTQAA
ncbi:FYVE zinc finger-domain-containing protein [Boletus reticuloceps]|uniref:FYVE zinc finger-domain-containing protein n=1 Tax=Boletus reticuloceps TaxID=495285 RepID=A0A8I2YV69_9AGAM|nr:FYVE zinc finger-domain-containing protein [Boletus reticuloceps]